MSEKKDLGSDRAITAWRSWSRPNLISSCGVRGSGISTWSRTTVGTSLVFDDYHHRMVLPLPSVLPPRLLLTLASAASHHVPSRSPLADPAHAVYTLARREEKHDAVFIVEACLIPLLVILSGIFAGLTLGYMSLDETQLNVLSVSGTP